MILFFTVFRNSYSVCRLVGFSNNKKRYLAYFSVNKIDLFDFTVW